MDLLWGDIRKLRKRAEETPAWCGIEEYFLSAEITLYDAREFLEPWEKPIQALAVFIPSLDLEIEQHGKYTFNGDFVSAVRFMFTNRNFPHKVEDTSILAMLAAFAAYEAMESLVDDDENFGLKRAIDAKDFLSAAKEYNASISMREGAKKGGQQPKRSEILEDLISYVWALNKDKTPKKLWEITKEIVNSKAYKTDKNIVMSMRFDVNEVSILVEDDKLSAYSIINPDKEKQDGRPIGLRGFEQIIHTLNLRDKPLE